MVEPDDKIPGDEWEEELLEAIVWQVEMSSVLEQKYNFYTNVEIEVKEKWW